MIVLEPHEVPKFLVGTSLRIAQREPKSVFGYLGDTVEVGVFVTKCWLHFINDDEPSVFNIEGVTFDGIPTFWAGRVDEITIRRLEDAGYVFSTRRLPPLRLYL